MSDYALQLVWTHHYVFKFKIPKNTIVVVKYKYIGVKRVYRGPWIYVDSSVLILFSYLINAALSLTFIWCSKLSILVKTWLYSAVRRGDVLAAWSGIRPLVTDPTSKDTQSICRNHIVSISDSGLVTIAGQFLDYLVEMLHQSFCILRWIFCASGGKWTTYRAMAEETLDAAVKSHGLLAEPCKTVGLMLEGGKGWTPTLYIRLVQDYGLENEVKHICTLQTT